VYKHLVVPQPVMQKTHLHLLPSQYSKLLLQQHLRLKMRSMRNQHLQPHQSQQLNQVVMPKTSWP
jgi:hypothetical protein